MVGTVQAERRTRVLEFGIYRDGDNNLDDIQSRTITQAIAASGEERSIAFTVEDTTSRRGFEPAHELRTETYTIEDGTPPKHVQISPPHDMSSRANLARFVALTLDNAERTHAAQTWIDLVDHGAGDGGGLESDHGLGIMREDDMAGAIADGVALHAKAHPEDAGRRVDGVVANQCLMATLGFESALSEAGVRYLAASPETMLAPGVPSGVAVDIGRNAHDPSAMATSLVGRVMNERYDAGATGQFGPAAAFDVFDLDPKKIAGMVAGVRTLDAALTKAAHSRAMRTAIREDAKAIEGMVRFPGSTSLPWRADRPALALYRTFAADGRLEAGVRSAARDAADAVAATVLAHGESDSFAPFHGADYSDAAGPTVHFPVTAAQIDAWAPEVSETDNAFYHAVGAGRLAKAVA
jgi:hypothetical protein